MKKWGYGIIAAITVLGAVTMLKTNLALAPAQTVQAKAKKTKPAKVTTKKKLTKYLKKTKNAGSIVKGIAIVKGVTTIKVKDVADLKPVYFEYLANILGRAKKTPLAKNGLGIVPTNEYMDGNGKKANMLEFSFFFAPADLEKLDFVNWGHVVYRNPTQFYNSATGYYLMTEFVKQAKQTKKFMPNSDLMKYDDQGMSVNYMDKYGA